MVFFLENLVYNVSRKENLRYQKKYFVFAKIPGKTLCFTSHTFGWHGHIKTVFICPSISYVRHIYLIWLM